MYSPSKHRFKRVTSMNATPEPPDMNLPSGKDHALIDDNDEYSEWSGFTSDAGSRNDAPTNSSASSEKQEREHAIFIPESSPLESSQSFIDALEYQPNKEDSVERDNSSESSFELPPHVFTKEPNEEDPINHESPFELSSSYLSTEEFNEENHVDLDSASESSFEMPPRVSINGRDISWLNDEDDERDVFLKQPRGKKHNTKFVSPPKGELQHPYLEWQLDKASMDKYMQEYPKQEGFAVNPEKEHKGRVIRWRCICAGKYKNHRNLSAEVGRQDIPLNNGAPPRFAAKNSAWSTSATKTWQ